jgi:hypothetical protein
VNDAEAQLDDFGGVDHLDDLDLKIDRAAGG